ncbi:MAG: electron transfer flavoprotein subunit beta/FixA family protein [Bacteroidales bacterium]
MKVLVCISNVPDTTTKIKLASDRRSVDLAGVQWIIEPWDELALTRALELREATPPVVTQVTVVTVGKIEAEPTLRKALAVGADDAIRIDAEANDAFSVASNLAEAIRNEAYDIILCGIESSDHNGSAVGGMLAELLGIASVSSVSSLSVDASGVLLTREIDGGKETVSVNGPFVAIVQKGISLVPRIPSMRGIMTARTKPLKVVPATASLNYSATSEYDLPQPKAACRMVPADNASELVRLLHEEAKVF